jgi:hypothetical protein
VHRYAFELERFLRANALCARSIEWPLLATVGVNLSTAVHGADWASESQSCVWVQQGEAGLRQQPHRQPRPVAAFGIR